MAAPGVVGTQRREPLPVADQLSPSGCRASATSAGADPVLATQGHGSTKRARGAARVREAEAGSRGC